MQTYRQSFNMDDAAKAGLVLAAAAVVQGLAAGADLWLGWGLTRALLPVTCGIGGLAAIVLVGCLIQAAVRRR